MAFCCEIGHEKETSCHISGSPSFFSSIRRQSRLRPGQVFLRIRALLHILVRPLLHAQRNSLDNRLRKNFSSLQSGDCLKRKSYAGKFAVFSPQMLLLRFPFGLFPLAVSFFLPRKISVSLLDPAYSFAMQKFVVAVVLVVHSFFSIVVSYSPIRLQSELWQGLDLLLSVWGKVAIRMKQRNTRATFHNRFPRLNFLYAIFLCRRVGYTIPTIAKSKSRQSRKMTRNIRQRCPPSSAMKLILRKSVVTNVEGDDY